MDNKYEPTTINFECPYCGMEINMDLNSKVCLCDLCITINGICQCYQCGFQEECNEECIRPAIEYIKKGGILYRIKNKLSEMFRM
jgi:hypothetical protein